jgi:hypothetical protein
MVLGATVTACDSTKNPNGGAPIKQMSQINVADEMVAKIRLLAIAHAEQGYQAMTTGDYATLDELKAKGYLPDGSGGQLNRYKFDVTLRPNGFEATAVPEKYGVTGVRSYYVDESQTLHVADKGGAKATASDPAM